MRTLGAVASERMQTQDVMREATPQDLAALRELERAAGAPFRGLGMDVVADDEPPSVTKLSEFQADGRAWVWTDRTSEDHEHMRACSTASSQVSGMRGSSERVFM